MLEALSRLTAPLTSPAGLRVELNANGSLRRFDCHDITLNLFVGNELEGGPTNLYLRRFADVVEWTPLLGPRSRTRFGIDARTGALLGTGSWLDIDYSIALVLAQSAPTWFWHVRLQNRSATSQHLDLTYAQDLALASYGAVRMNEFYVSQYVDHTPLSHAIRGVVVASRQNMAADGRHPWSLIGSLRTGTSCATDAMQFHGLSSRRDDMPVGLAGDLPTHRLQHEHSMVVVRDAPIVLDPNCDVTSGFFGTYVADHPDATSTSDLDKLAGIFALPESVAPPAGPPAPSLAAPSPVRTPPAGRPPTDTSDFTTLFSAAARINGRDLEADELRELFGSSWRHEEHDERGGRLSFFHSAGHHVVLRAKELRVQRPHGHLLRTGNHTTPDESGLTSTVWMNGVFHSMLTQGHVSINRFLSTVRSYLGLFRSHGQRVFVEIDGAWRLLDMPSAFEMSPDLCRWIYRHDAGEIQVRAEARSEPHELTLSISVTSGDPARFLISNHIALNGDDGSTPGAAHWSRNGNEIVITPGNGSEVAQRFPQGSFKVVPLSGTAFQQVAGDEVLFADGQSRGQPYICVVTEPARMAALSIRGCLVAENTQAPLKVATAEKLIPTPTLSTSQQTPLSRQLARIADIVPWYTQNALVHYLSPRGLEQYSGGGWGTRDVCQGPVEMLLALGRLEPIRDLLLRVMGMQNPDGDWPQWFMFFERERNIRPDDSHGDVIFWPLLVFGQYLIASGDVGLLNESVPFFDSRGVAAGERATVWQHVERALSLIEKRVIPGTALAAYGHGDWNDSLQPADPKMRDRMCSAWTVTLHYQTLKTLMRALRSIGRAQEAVRFESWAQTVLHDFQRYLIVDGVLTGYAHFEDDSRVRYLLHPRDETTGVRYSSLAMIHAILEDMLTSAQIREHLKIIETHLSGPDGVRLFDRPMPYHGGTQRIFQRAETATFFGREIGLMYTHAHLRYAQALAHIGEAERFFHALCQANPIGIKSIVPTASLRQANCYYSSSDAAFADRYQAREEYARVSDETIALDGGWRVYSSGAGIALGLILRRFLGLSYESGILRVDPVIPSSLDGLKLSTTLLGHPIEVHYQVGRTGCGVRNIMLNGELLSFEPDENPNRRGAALVPAGPLLKLLADAHNILKIDIG